VSRLLGEMWRNASASERAPYIEDEEHERAVYKEEIRRFREDQVKMDAASRRSHREIAASPMEDFSQNPFRIPPVPDPALEHYRSYENNVVDYGRLADKRVHGHFTSQPGDASVASRSGRSYQGHHIPSYRPVYQSGKCVILSRILGDILSDTELHL
jgi:hypothetical protein